MDAATFLNSVERDRHLHELVDDYVQALFGARALECVVRSAQRVNGIMSKVCVASPPAGGWRTRPPATMFDIGNREVR
jgi:hypothetical protein